MEKPNENESRVENINGLPVEMIRLSEKLEEIRREMNEMAERQYNRTGSLSPTRALSERMEAFKSELEREEFFQRVRGYVDGYPEDREEKKKKPRAPRKKKD